MEMIYIYVIYVYINGGFSIAMLDCYETTFHQFFFTHCMPAVLSDCWTRSAFFYILRCTVLVLMCS